MCVAILTSIDSTAAAAAAVALAARNGMAWVHRVAEKMFTLKI